jgi:hypothetical protein
MERLMLRKSLLPVLVLLGLVAVLVAWAPTAAADTAAPVAVSAQANDAAVRFGEDVTVSTGETSKDVVAFGGDIDVQGVVEGSAVAFGGTVNVSGVVQGPVVAFGGTVNVSGTVGEEVVAFGGQVNLASTAKVGTTLNPDEDGVITFGGDVTVAPGADVTGDVRELSGGDVGDVIGWLVGTGATAPVREFFSFGW